MFTGTLKPYQVEPVDSFLERGNLLVAYEMGLGKTIIGIAAAEKLFAAGKIKCCVIVCQASLKYQWAQRIAEFTNLPGMYKSMRDETIRIPAEDCAVVDGTIAQRNDLYEVVAGTKLRPHYIIMGYDNVINDNNWVRKIKPDMVILDEATAIKTFRAKRTKQIKKILNAKYKMALTGTPIENKPDELFSIMQWVDETVLGRYDLFDKAYMKRNGFGWVIAYKNLPVLKKRLGSAMSRKSREDPDVKPFLPAVDESEWFVEMPHNVEILYKKIAKDMLIEMSTSFSDTHFDMNDYYTGVDESTPSGKLMGMHMTMEMLLNHPDLIIISAENGAAYAGDIWKAGLIDDILESQKLNVMKDKVAEILQYPENKILIYTFYRGMLDIMEDELNVPCVQFHGGLSPTDKSAAVTRFTNDDSCRVFLSSHAGAYGMDMSMANYLINYDLPWSSGKADQINGRHVRVSSEFGQVYIRNLITEGTIEARKLRILDRKRRIAGAVIDGRGADEFGRIKIDEDSLTEHLTAVA